MAAALISAVEHTMAEAVITVGTPTVVASLPVVSAVAAEAFTEAAEVSVVVGAHLVAVARHEVFKGYL